jgi:hypothetical protein
VLIIDILQQFVGTAFQSIGYLKRGKYKGAVWWFFVRNWVSLVGNWAGRNSSGYRVNEKLNFDGVQQLPKLSSETVGDLRLYFLCRSDCIGSDKSLCDYFEARRMTGEVRPTGFDISLEKNLMISVLRELEIIPVVLDYLNLPIQDISFNAKIDALVNLESRRIMRNGYDDALEFHRDVDSLSFVKAFVYLTDVEKGFGHHEVFLGTHKRLPLKLKLIKRFSQEYLIKSLPGAQLKELVGSSGYSWIEDTTTFHRGTVPVAGDRLMLSLSFNDTRSVKHLEDGTYYSLSSVASLRA